MAVNRRAFIKTAAGGTLAGAHVVRLKPDTTDALQRDNGAAAQRTASSTSDRDSWVAVMRRLADPVLTNLANGTLKARMPVEQAPGADRRGVTHLEALGRLMAGIAPWIELPPTTPPRGAAARSMPRLRTAPLHARSIPRRRTS